MRRLRATGEALLGRARTLAPGATDGELALLGGAMALGLAIVVVYLLLTRDHALAGDEPEYHAEGVFFTQGKLWWSTLPFGIAHESMWKAPIYPAWVGLWYEVLGTSPLRVELVQALLAPVTVALTWLLARRLFGPRVAIASAVGVAVFPLAWESYGLLLPEALAIPLTLLLLLVACDRDPSPGRAAAVGALLGIGLLVRPSSFFLLAGIAVAWIVTTGWRRGLGRAALAAIVAGLVVLPWTIRNYAISDGDFVPISIQDAAAYGTFSPEAAADEVRPYAWRPDTAGLREVLARGPVDDAEFRSRLQELARDYIADHPDSVPKAFFWNGVTRFWDLRRPARSLDEAPFENRTRGAKAIGLAMYYVLLPLAIAGLWRHRRRREFLYPALVVAIAASAVFTIDASSRYRAILEPPLVILAASLLAPASAGATARAPGSRRMPRP